MVESTRLNSKLKSDSKNYSEYEECVIDLLAHDTVLSMKEFIQHGNFSCYEHSKNVSYYSYCICKRFRLDHNSAARGALLHDLFLYDWHTTKLEKGLHGFSHPKLALENANRDFELNHVEKDIIVKHMWPLTISPPRYLESFVVMLVDKYCTIMEMTKAASSYLPNTKIHKSLEWD